MIEQVTGMFTGSVKTGRHVSQQAAACFIPAFLELGGKDPAIVLPDADIPLAARAIIRSAIGMTGQACQSLERIYCHKSIAEPFNEELLAQLKVLCLTCTEDGAGDIAPLIFERQVETIQAQVDDALAKGATCLWAVSRYWRGHLVPPTLLTNVNHDMLIMQEETFGPVIPLSYITMQKRPWR